MSATAAVLLTLGLVILGLGARVPVAFTLAGAGLAGIFMLEGSTVAMGTAGNLPLNAIARYTLIIIPMFVAMGVFARRAGVATESFAVAARALGRVPGGLALATLVACGAFAAVTGSSVATVATIGRVAIAEMCRHGYRRDFAAGVVGAAGTLGVLIPPSIALVIYGIITQERIGDLLIGGVVPGLLSMAIYALVIITYFRKHKEEIEVEAQRIAREEHADSVEQSSGGAIAVRATGHRRAPQIGLVGSLRALSRVALLAGVVIGGIYSGFFTPTESASIGATLAFLMFLWSAFGQPLRASFSDLAEGLREVIAVTTMIFALLVGASIFTFFLTVARVPTNFAEWAAALDIPSALIVAILLLLLIPLGMFLDPLSLMLIVIPVMYPVVNDLGYDGIWFGILVVKMTEIGLITPPVGINAYVVAGASDELTVPEAFTGVLKFLPADLATVGILFAFPSLVLWLPGLMS